ncbi:MAG: DUF3426 domain-containing protein [Thermomonas sp.]|jgi:hypothetical protein|uniref:DUF3426 domain-containing protein n=1 Tax=Thermomonas sp. TaxID=1971895 RepID=UPI001ED13918|nr:DUF3426 domain-containing protein [Thermomonas sp.]MBV2208714.1 DUF3426 domain-containing protein [Thermomonas sp.]
MTQAPSFASDHSAPRHPHRKEWSGALLLALVLIAQLIWLQRDALAASSRLRPMLETLCSALTCSLPTWHDPTSFTMLSRDVIAPPDQRGVLRVQASFRNDAHWPQAWPVLVLNLTDVNGQSLGARRFQPAEYLGSTPHVQRILPNQANQIAFDLHEPSSAVVSFDFRFE